MTTTITQKAQNLLEQEPSTAQIDATLTELNNYRLELLNKPSIDPADSTPEAIAAFALEQATTQARLDQIATLQNQLGNKKTEARKREAIRDREKLQVNYGKAMANVTVAADALAKAWQQARLAESALKDAHDAAVGRHNVWEQAPADVIESAKAARDTLKPGWQTANHMPRDFGFSLPELALGTGIE